MVDPDTISTFTVPIGGSGSEFIFIDQGITFDSGYIRTSVNAGFGTLNGTVTGLLEMAPTEGASSFGIEFRVDVYVRGTSECYAVQCESEGSIAVSHPGDCFGPAGPFVEATWNGQTVGSLDFCTVDETLLLESDDCDVSGASCCRPVVFPDDPETEYSLAFSKNFSGLVSQLTPGPLQGGVPITASLEVSFTVSARRGCGPAPDQLNILSFSRSRAGTCGSVEWDVASGNAFSDIRGALADPANFGVEGTFPSALSLVPPVDSLTVSAFQDVDIFLLGPNIALTDCERDLLDRFVTAGGGLFAFQNDADVNAGPIFGAAPGVVGSACGSVSNALSPVVNGPFGTASGCITPQYHRNFSYVGPEGSTFLSDGAPVGVSFNHGLGRAVLICDEEWCANLNVGDCLSGGGSSGNYELFMNAVAYVAPDFTPAAVIADCQLEDLCGLSFDGIDDQVIVPYTSALPNTEYTITAGIQTDFSSGTQTIMSRGEAASNDALTWSFAISNGLLTLQIENGSSSGAIYEGTRNVGDGKPHHVAVSRSEAGEVVFYLDGLVDAVHGTTIDPIASSEKDLQIGFSYQNSGPPPQPANLFYEGVLEDVTLWTRSLSAVEIETLANEESPMDTTGLLGHWPFRDGDGQTAADVSGAPLLTAILGADPGPDDGDPLWICPPDTRKPDLVITLVDTDDLQASCITQITEGQAMARVLNRGETTPVTGYSVRFFEDRNGNQTFDSADDLQLALQPVPTLLAPGEEVDVSAPITAKMLFAGNLVYASVDPDNVVVEMDETNNTGVSGAACLVDPVPGEFNPVLEWSWTSSSVKPNAIGVVTAPAVCDLDDDGIPDIVFVSWTYGSVDEGFLRALRGSDGRELFTISDPTYRLKHANSVAIGDIDGDGRPEIIGQLVSETQAVAFEHDGDVKWLSAALEPHRTVAPAIADLDHDGSPEIVIGRQVLNANGILLWTGDGGTGGGEINALATVADIDLDGDPEIICGNTVYSPSGSVEWQRELPDGFNAVANFDTDPFGEVVLVAEGKVWLLEHTGATKWGPTTIPGGGFGGPPTVADFDGDGFAEIGVAGATRYVVLESNGDIKWQKPTQDGSSNITGSSVFDFEGDGSAEVIYQDEVALRVYRGVDGEILFETPSNTGTRVEYPLVADIDADGNAEIVTVANRGGNFGPFEGVYVYGDPNNNWVATRRIWNQHSYHITNVNDDGSIPAFETNNWLFPGGDPYNSFRQNVLTSASPFAAPDLTASALTFDLSGCTDSLGISVRIGNGGLNVAPTRIPVTFYNGNPEAASIDTLGTVETSRPLGPGEFEDIFISFPAPEAGDHRIYVCVDDGGAGQGAVDECNELNNVCSAPVTVEPKPQCVLLVPESLPLCESSGNQICVDEVFGDVATYQWKMLSSGDTSGWLIEDGEDSACLTYRTGSSEDTATVRVIVTSEVGCVDSCEVRFTCAEDGSICTLTQEQWGELDSATGALRQAATIASLVSDSNPLVLGVPRADSLSSHGSLRFNDAGEMCALLLLPGSGPATEFVSDLDDVVPALGNACSIAPEPTTNGKLNNALASETLTLQLNARLQPRLEDVELSSQLVLYRAEPGPDQALGSGDDTCTSDAVGALNFGPELLSSLDILGLPRSVGGLLALANQSLSGLPVGSTSPGELAAACLAINEGFAECRCLSPGGDNTITLGVGDNPPTAFLFSRVSPNPVHTTAYVRFELPARASVSIQVFNVSGQRVTTLAGESFNSGAYRASWDLKDLNGQRVASGLYFLQMRARAESGEEFQETRRVVVIR